MTTREEAAEYVRLIEASHGPRDRRLDDARTIVALYDELERQRERADGVLESASALEQYAIAGCDTLAHDHLLAEAIAERDAARGEVATLTASLRLAEASVSLLRADVADRERERERLQNMIWAANGVLSDNGCDCDCGHHWEEHEPDCERCLACRIDNAMRAAVPGSV